MSVGTDTVAVGGGPGLGCRLTWPLARIFFSSAEDFFRLQRKDHREGRRGLCLIPTESSPGTEALVRARSAQQSGALCMEHVQACSGLRRAASAVSTLSSAWTKHRTQTLIATEAEKIKHTARARVSAPIPGADSARPHAWRHPHSARSQGRQGGARPPAAQTPAGTPRGGARGQGADTFRTLSSFSRPGGVAGNNRPQNLQCLKPRLGCAVEITLSCRLPPSLRPGRSSRHA